MRVRLPHSNGVFLSRWGTPLTDLRASVADGKRFCPGTCVPVSKTLGNLPCLGAKSIHFVGYLPKMPQNGGRSTRCHDMLHRLCRKVDKITAIPITEWENQDTALADVARQIRIVVNDLRTSQN